MKQLSGEARRVLEILVWAAIVLAVGPVVVLGVLLAAILGGSRR